MTAPDAPHGGYDVIKVQGALLEVWNHWSGDYSPPEVSMITGKTMEDLHTDEQMLERERVRLSLQLEQDAKKRLAMVECAEASGQSLNAFCQVYLARSKMLAWSFIFPPAGPEGKMLGESVGKALAQSGVTTGIDSGAVVSIFQEPMYFKLIPIAIGTPPVEGKNGSVTERFPRTIAKEVKVDENGVADYRAGSYVQLIEKDAVICDIELPQPGAPGVRVDGKIIEPKPVKPAHVPAGANTVLAEDGKKLIAAREGHLEFINDAFQVHAVLEVKGDVDYSTGNIDFPGDVHVCGDIRENFTVRASGSIAVDGIVEAATVEAGGDIVITRGVVGDNRALLRSHGTVRVKYLENCVVYAAKGIYADCIMNAQIFSDDVISVMSGRGSVIGGALTAARLIQARMIGAQSGRRTELRLGVLPYVQSELQNIQEDLRVLEREREQLDKELSYLESKQGLEGSSGKIAKARIRRSVLGIKEQQLNKHKEQLTPMEADIAKCRMECDMVYPGTTLTVGELGWSTRQTRRYCKVVYDIRTGELKEIS
ncbi:FapA family protein [Intestinimonas sp.]|uniref:FapA family protein n=1 Tax=Intestinimonas sp. TaxID=1965293 RepID=UPI00261B8FA6|nr:FapA family protein [Intestinimonas sp.]